MPIIFRSANQSPTCFFYIIVFELLEVKLSITCQQRHCVMMTKRVIHVLVGFVGGRSTVDLIVS